MCTVATCAAYVVVLAGGHPFSTEGVADVVEAVVVLLAMLQTVDNVYQL